jgi:uncharacterized protein (TIGR03790 family)
VRSSILRLGFLLTLNLHASQPAAALGAPELAVVINELDAVSVRTGEYYARVRQIPGANVLRVRIDNPGSTLSESEFATLQAELDARTPAGVQGYALTWVHPWRVECMSITTAVAAGFDRRWCSDGCIPTRLNPYFNSDSRRPRDDLKLRPTMSVAANDFEGAKALIDRGLAASARASAGKAPPGKAYLLSTDDAARNVRAPGYGDAKLMVAGRVPVEILHAPALQGRNDVLFYFIGAMHVPELLSNRFVPGAVGDHLTSTGGNLLGMGQMSALRWLEAGATGSYGTVVEPCNFTAKFPNVGLMMRRYLGGETLLEAYWKSVAMPGQGIFVGEPLATIAARPAP